MTQIRQANTFSGEDDAAFDGGGPLDQTDLALVDAALARIKAGTFGVCTRCCGPISIKRLEVMPCTPICETCARSKQETAQPCRSRL